MGKCYSLDLRDRVIERVSAGQSRREAARHFAVSPSFAIKLLARHRKTGGSPPAKQGRPRGCGKLEPHRAFLIGCVRQKPDITMPELARGLQESCHVEVTPASLSRFLCKAGFTYKKNAAGIGARTLGCEKGETGLESFTPAPHAA